MKPWYVILIMVFALALVVTPANATPAQKDASVPKYDRAAEAVFKGVIEEVKNRECPISGGMGAHLTVKLSDGQVVEVHLATTKFVQDYELVFSKGDEIQITGVKVKFEDKDAILVREIKRGNDVFVFRDKDGKPVW
jgi:DNA/RNA endonuclease YhcR with UshA esterase domain